MKTKLSMDLVSSLVEIDSFLIWPTDKGSDTQGGLYNHKLLDTSWSANTPLEIKSAGLSVSVQWCQQLRGWYFEFQ